MLNPGDNSLTEEELRGLLDRAQTGCPAAAQQLFDLYREPVKNRIRRMLDGRMRSAWDSDDFLMQTFEAAFTWKLEKPTQLLAFLLGIAEHKVLDAQRRFLVREGSRRHVSLHELKGQKTPCSKEILPLDVLIIKETSIDRINFLIDGFPADVQEVIRKVIQGKRIDQMAKEYGVNLRRAYRAMAWLRDKLTKFERTGGGGADIDFTC